MKLQFLIDTLSTLADLAGKDAQISLEIPVVDDEGATVYHKSEQFAVSYGESGLVLKGIDQ